MKSKKIVIGITIFFIISICLSINTQGANTGACDPSSTGDNNNEWLTPTRAYTQDDRWARGYSGNPAQDEQDYYTFDFSFTNFYEILGIELSIDGFASGKFATLSAKLSWDGGSSYTSAKGWNSMPASDTDTYYVYGSPTDNWGHTWTEDEFSNANFRLHLRAQHILSARYVYVDHMYINVFYKAEPTDVTNFKSISVSCSKNVNLSWTNPTNNFDNNNDYIRIQRDTTDYPNSISDGTNIYNNTPNSATPYYIDTTTNYDTLYYYSIWAFNLTYHLWSDGYDTAEVRTPCDSDCPDYNECPNISTIQYYNYSDDTIKYFNISITNEFDNTTCTHWVNETIIGYEVNETECPEYNECPNYSNIVYYNYSDDDIIYFNISIEDEYDNSTCTHWVNSTQNGYELNTTACDSCCPSYSDIKYFEYSDDNMTKINVSIEDEYDNTTCTHWANASMEEYEINEDNWLEIAGFSLESGELGIVLVFLLFAIAFNIDQEEKKNIWKPILFFLDTPIALATGIFYIGNTWFSIEWWAGICLFSFAIILSMAGLYYGLNFGRR